MAPTRLNWLIGHTVRLYRATGDEQVYRGRAIRSGTVATRPRPSDPRLDPGGVRGEWCWQENTNGEQIFRPGACKPKAGSLNIDRMTLETGRLSCVFDNGTVSDGTLKMRMHYTDSEEKQPSIYGAQLTLQPGKKIELIMEPMDQQ
jgi:hypothetical protein